MSTYIYEVDLEVEHKWSGSVRYCMICADNVVKITTDHPSEGEGRYHIK